MLGAYWSSPENLTSRPKQAAQFLYPASGAESNLNISRSLGAQVKRRFHWSAGRRNSQWAQSNKSRVEHNRQDIHPAVADLVFVCFVLFILMGISEFNEIT
jgi:hypothetical protein